MAIVVFAGLVTAFAGAVYSFAHGVVVSGALCCVTVLLCGSALVFRAVARGRFASVTVRGMSMEPAYRQGERVLVSRRSPLRVGGVVVVEQPTESGEWLGAPLRPGAAAKEISRRRWLIKRIAALPGDEIRSEHLPHSPRAYGRAVPAGSLVLLGDNRRVSFDSRSIGFFPAERVLGVVVQPTRE
ncbi:S26 family signal peptidase [Nonomuraea roseoviolacea]|uniref:S26 family signal peptidase n=1 Tax=Nonomuraea roseoviolacea TaxID=103837 RepID=UPI0020A41540|nr:S26 family signal peptidase [Nonomuraea roseoviolacea]